MLRSTKSDLCSNSACWNDYSCFWSKIPIFQTLIKNKLLDEQWQITTRTKPISTLENRKFNVE